MFKSKFLYFFSVFFLITPIISMLLNFFKIDCSFFWYIPNILMFYFGLKFLILNLKNFNKIEFTFMYLYFIFAIFSCFFSTHSFESFFGSLYRCEGLITYISYLGFFYIGTKIRNKNLLNIFIVVSFIISLFSILRIDLTYKFFNIPTDIHYYQYVGPFFHFNHFGYYILLSCIVISVLFIFNKDKKINVLYYFFYLVLIYTLIINDTFGVYLAYLITLIFIFIYFIIKRKYLKKIILIFCTFIFFSCITYRYDYNIHIVYRNFSELFFDTKTITSAEKVEDVYEVGTTRGKLWLKGVDYILKKPLLGYGYENVKYEYQKDGILESKPHNLILDLCLNTGILSMICYIGILILIFLKNFRSISYKKNFLCFSIIFGFLLCMMTGNSTFYVSPYFYVFLGVFSCGGCYGEKV